MIKAKNKQQKLIKHKPYRKYRNKIIELIRKSKQTYYQHHFEQKKKIPKQYGKVFMKSHLPQKNKKGGNVSAIIADDNTITNPIEIAENFNDFFTSIGANLQKKTPPTKNTFTDYLKKLNSKTSSKLLQLLKKFVI